MKLKIYYIFAVSLLIYSCGGNETTSISPTSSPILNTETPTAPLPSPTLPPEKNTHPLTGLIYRNDTGLWQINQEGISANLFPCSGAGLSEDGNFSLIVDQEDIWLLDLTTCDPKNLTNTTDDYELNPFFWPGNPNIVVFGVNPDFDAGYPAAINLDGSDYRTIDSNVSLVDTVSLSSDGNQIAYPSFSGPMIFNWSSNSSSLFDITAYDLEPGLVEKMKNASWSPNGEKLAWVSAINDGPEEGIFLIGIVIFDIPSHTASIIHPYIPIGRDGWPSAPAWSPDGNWLAFNAWDQDPQLSGIWVSSIDGVKEYHLEVDNPENSWLIQSHAPIWSPDGDWLAFSLWLSNANNFWVAKVGEWAPANLPLPDGSHLVDWR